MIYNPVGSQGDSGQVAAVDLADPTGHVAGKWWLTSHPIYPYPYHLYRSTSTAFICL